MGGDSIALDTVLDLGGDPRRRVVLAVLVAEQRTLTVNDVAKAILEYDHDTPVTEASGAELARIRTALHHVHLPKLEAAGLVEYDPERRLVEPTERFERLQSSLAALVDVDPQLDAPVELEPRSAECR